MSLLFFGIILFAAFTHGFTGLGFGIIIMACLAASPWTAEVTAAYSTILVIFVFFVILLAERKAFKANWWIFVLLIAVLVTVLMLSREGNRGKIKSKIRTISHKTKRTNLNKEWNDYFNRNK